MSPVISLQNVKTGKLTALALAAPTSGSKSCPTCRPWRRPAIRSTRPTGSAWWRPPARRRRSLAKLEKALAEVLAMPDVRKRLTDMGAIIEPLNGKQFGDYIQRRTGQMGGHRQEGRRQAELIDCLKYPAPAATPRPACTS